MLNYTTLSHPVPAPGTLALASLTLDPITPLAITPVVHPRDGVADPNSRAFWSAVGNAFYIVRQEGEDMFGATPSLAAKLALGNDLVEHGRRGPIGCDGETISGLKLWHAADAAATRDQPSAPVAHHLIGFFPPELDLTVWREIVFTFVRTQLVSQGMIVDWAIHALGDGQGGWLKKPHVHLLVTHRFWKASERQGEPHDLWLATAGSRKRLTQAWADLTHAARVREIADG